MNPEFWINRWENGAIGFHLDHVNPHLQAYWPMVSTPAGRVLVPLCGKSLDMQWLCQQGHAVLGVELSELAVADFFKQTGQVAEVTQQGPFKHWQAGPLELLCGDFFQLSAAHVADCSMIYDRAALIALPEDMRVQYVHHLRAIFPQGVQMLLVTMEYPQHEISGPPFSVDAQAVQDLFAPWAEVRQLASHDVLAENERFQQRGATRLYEHVFHIQIKP